MATAVATRYPQEVDDAIKEACAARMRPSDVRRKLAAGTLEGLSGPVDMKERTFFRRWIQAKKDQARKPKRDGDDPPLFHRLIVALQRERDPEAPADQLAAAIGAFPVSDGPDIPATETYVQKCLDASARRLSTAGWKPA